MTPKAMQKLLDYETDPDTLESELQDAVRELWEAARWRDSEKEKASPAESPIEILEPTPPATISEAHWDAARNRWLDSGGFIICNDDLAFWRPLVLPKGADK